MRNSTFDTRILFRRIPDMQCRIMIKSAIRSLKADGVPVTLASIKNRFLTIADDTIKNNNRRDQITATVLKAIEGGAA